MVFDIAALVKLIHFWTGIVLHGHIVCMELCVEVSKICLGIRELYNVN